MDIQEYNETMKPKMTLDKLAEIIERTVAKKEDIEALRADLRTELASKKDVARLESEIEDLKVKHNRLESKVDKFLDTVTETEHDQVKLDVRVTKLEKRVFANP